MTRQHEFDVVVVGANADGLALAASLSESGKKTALLESDMKVGGELLTESFLSSHRYNLSGGWLLADSLAGIDSEHFNKMSRHLLLPDIPIAFLFEKQEPLIFDRSLNKLESQIRSSDKRKLRRLVDIGESIHLAVFGRFLGNQVKISKRELLPLSDKSVKEVLDHYEFTDARLRCALTYLPLAMGWDIEKPGSGIVMAFLLFSITRLSLVNGGSGLLANSLADTVIIKNGMIIESARIKKISLENEDFKSIELEDGRKLLAPVIAFANRDMMPESGDEKSKQTDVDHSELGVYRIYLDFSRSPTGFNSSGVEAESLRNAYMITFGFNNEQDVYRYLKMIKAGQPPFVAGHVISNNFLDATDPVGALGMKDGPLWCTSCHTTDRRQLRDRAKVLERPEQTESLNALRSDKGFLFGIDPENEKDESGFRIRPAPGSLIWQGVLSMQSRTIDSEGFRKSFEAACIAAICQKVTGIEPQDIRFKLTWLPNEVREPLLRIDVEEMLFNQGVDQNYETNHSAVFVDPYARLARYTGMRSAQKFISVLSSNCVPS